MLTPTASTSTPRATKGCVTRPAARFDLDASISPLLPPFRAVAPSAVSEGSKNSPKQEDSHESRASKTNRQQGHDEVSQALERGHSETLRKYLAAMARFRRYSWHNVAMIFSQRPNATQVAGFHTWKQLGRTVKKGSKGIMILAPILVRKSKEEVADEQQSRTALGFRAVYVFDQADTEGEPFSELCSHWERTKIMDIEIADTMPDGCQLWLDWHRL